MLLSCNKDSKEIDSFLDGQERALKAQEELFIVPDATLDYYAKIKDSVSDVVTKLEENEYIETKGSKKQKDLYFDLSKRAQVLHSNADKAVWDALLKK